MSTRTRRRYPVGWEGKGRYIPNTLRIYDKINNKYLEKDVEYIEEDNCLFYRFLNNPVNNNYDDYEVSFLVQEDDYNFSNGDHEDNIKVKKYGINGKCTTEVKEEYFLWPNWNNAPGNGDGVWIGKYLASRSDATDSSFGSSTVPVSVRGVRSWDDLTIQDTSLNANNGALSYLYNRNHRCRTIRNREWASIGYWALHHQYDGEYNSSTNPKAVTGYIYDFHENSITSSQLNLMGITLNELKKITYQDNKVSKLYPNLTGSGPNTWRHNLKESGIADMIGNMSEIIIGITRVDNGIYLYNDQNKFVTITSDTYPIEYYCAYINTWYPNNDGATKTSNRVYYREDNNKPIPGSYEGISVATNSGISNYIITKKANAYNIPVSGLTNINISSLHNKSSEELRSTEIHWDQIYRGFNARNIVSDGFFSLRILSYLSSDPKNCNPFRILFDLN